MSTERKAYAQTTNGFKHKLVKDINIKVRKFCRMLERNMNNYLPTEVYQDPNRLCRGFFLKIDSVNGIKKVSKNNQTPDDKNYYLRFFLTFFNQKTSQFFGSTYKSPLLSIRCNETGHYELTEPNATYVYCLTSTAGSVTGVQSSQMQNTNRTSVQNQCVIEVVLVETNKNNYILNQTCEGWGILEVTEDPTLESKQNSSLVYMGTSRSLLNKNGNTSKLLTIAGASIIYSCSQYKELEKLKFLLPNYVILGYKDSLPGLLFNFLPKKPILNEPVRLVEFHDVYLKNVEIEISPNLENRLIYYANMYRKQKYEIADDAQLNAIIVKERKLRCGIHNSWTFINSNGLENFVSLNKKENFLFYKGLQHIDNYFANENCAFILELSYTLSLPGPKNQREDVLQTIIGYSIVIPEAVDMENNFRTANLITGPGMTVYGEHLYDPLDSDDKVIKINYILSKNKDNYDKTFKEKEVEDLRSQMEVLKKSMMDEYNKMLTNKDKEKEELMRKKERELEEMEEKLKESQRGLKTIYGKDDIIRSKNISEVYLPNNVDRKSFSNDNKIVNNANINSNSNTKFIIDEGMIPDENALDERFIDELNNKNNFDTNVEKNISIIDENYEKEGNNKKQTVKSKFLEHIPEMRDDSYSKYNNNPILDTNENMRENYNQRHSTNNGNDYNNNVNTNNNNNFDDKFDSRKSLMEVKKSNNRYETTNDNNYDRDEYIFYKMFYKKHKMELGNEGNKEEMSKHIPKIIYDQSSKDISRRDKADLIARGLLNLETGEKNGNILNFTLEKELKDDKKGQSFVFHFLAFKPMNDIKDYDSIPDKIFFRFNFWDFEYFSTNVAVVSKPNSNVVPSSTPLILQRENSVLNAKSDEKEMKVQVDFDPSVDPYMDYIDFINYLLNKQLFIEIFEAEKQFFLGYVKVPLRDLLRQGKPSVYQTKEFEIYDEKFIPKGYLQILLKSCGMSTHKSFIYDPSVLKIINTKDRFQGIPKKKKIKSKPLDIEKMMSKEKEHLAKTLIQGGMGENAGADINSLSNNSNNKTLKLNVDLEMQKKLRAMKYVTNNSNVNVKNDLMFSEHRLEELKVKQEKENDFYKTLNYAKKIKEIQKKEILSKPIQDNNKNTLSVSLIAGQPFLTNFIIHNNSENDELLQLIVSKPSEVDSEARSKMDDEKSKSNSFSDVVSIVNSPEEWKYLTENHQMIRPNDYYSISPQNYLVIKPNESIPVLVKLLSFDEHISNSNYCVWVYKKSGQPLYFLSLTIVKVFPLIDHIFRFNMPENKYGTIKIPNPFKYDKMKTQKVLDNYICTDTMTNLQLDSSTNDFYFKGKMQSEGHVNELYLFIYLDGHRSNLYATWKFEINSMANIDVHAQIGSKITQKLQLEAERNPRTIQFFSSNPEILFFSEKFNSPIILVPHIANEIKYMIYPKKEDNYEVLINCVDISNREVVKGWLVKILPDKPEINHVHKIDCKVNSVTNIKYEYTNSLNSWVIFNFESNNTELLNIIDSRLPFNPSENKYINISIVAQTQMGRAEVLVFVSDTEELYSETILFQLNYK